MANRENRKLLAEEQPLAEFSRSGDVPMAVAYPNRYWIAMSNLGFQAVYGLFSKNRRFSVDRAFYPEDSSDAPNFRSFERDLPLSSLELLAVSVSFETDYPYLLAMLEGAGLDLERGTLSGDEEARRYRPFLLGGGAAITLNPEPIAKFFDAIVIGEAEEVVKEISDVFLEARETGKSHEELLYALAKLEGVYVPRFYSVSYASNGAVSNFSAKPGAPNRVKRRYVENIDAYPTRTLVKTPNTEFKSMFMTETGRGCEVGCKFCVAGYMYRPTRKRSEDVIAETVQVGVENGESVGFVGAAVSSHPGIARLAKSVADEGKRASLSSIMSQRVSKELAASLSESEYKTVALAPEAGSEALRFRIGKRVCDEQIVSAISTLAAEGIRNFKLYFIVGLPSETVEDVAAIVDLVAAAKEEALRAARSQEDFRTAPRLILSVNPFIPKAWTPFQRQPFLGFKEIKRRLRIVQDGVRRIPNVEMKFESPRESYFQTLVSRGDRRVADLLIHMHREGHDWRWLVKSGREEILAGVPAADFYVERAIPLDELLPWEIVDMRIKRGLLDREAERTFSMDVQPLIERARRNYQHKLDKQHTQGPEILPSSENELQLPS